MQVNILIDGNHRVKISDSSLAGLSRRSSFTFGAAVDGSVRWMAPELLGGGECTAASDVYAFGMTVLEVRGDKV